MQPAGSHINFSSQTHNWENFSTGEDAWSIVINDDKLRIVLNKWMGKIFNNTYVFKVKEFTEIDENNTLLKTDSSFKELYLYDKKWNVPLSHQDVGFGISQVLPILVTSLAEKYKKILIEQPELHLHPALQAEIGDMFIESALGQNNNTFLLETHSEHLILRIMRRIRECYHDPEKYEKETGFPRITPDDVAVLYVERQGDQSVVKEMYLDDQGYLIDEWPGDFFSERLNELI